MVPMQYEEEVAANPLNYDTWFDYLKLEESLSGPAVVRGVYERAVACIPPLSGKVHWCRYIYLWIKYARAPGNHALLRCSSRSCRVQQLQALAALLARWPTAACVC
jgi:hypothetical protein